LPKITKPKSTQRKSLSFEKGACEMLMKLTPGVDLNNILRAAFTSADPKSAERH